MNDITKQLIITLMSLFMFVQLALLFYSVELFSYNTYYGFILVCFMSILNITLIILLELFILQNYKHDIKREKSR